MYPQYKCGKRNTHNRVCGAKEEDGELVWTALAFRYWYICLLRKNKMDEMQIQQRQTCKKKKKRAFLPSHLQFLRQDAANSIYVQTAQAPDS